MLTTIAMAVALSGCGATKAISGAVDPVAQAAVTTSHAAGYRMSVTTEATGAGTTVRGIMTGAIDTATHTGAFTLHETVAGHAISILERQSGTSIYMKLPNQAALASVTGGKPWLKLDFSRALGAFGLGGLPTQSTNPGQFIDYLRAAGDKPKRVGTETVDGAQTTHYHVVVNLDSYAKLVPPAQRAAAARGVSTLESAIGSHTIPMDAWIASQRPAPADELLVRRVRSVPPAGAGHDHAPLGLRTADGSRATRALRRLRPHATPGQDAEELQARHLRADGVVASFQRPFHSGARFSKNARTPSWMSSVENAIVS